MPELSFRHGRNEMRARRRREGRQPRRPAGNSWTASTSPPESRPLAPRPRTYEPSGMALNAKVNPARWIWSLSSTAPQRPDNSLVPSERPKGHTFVPSLRDQHNGNSCASGSERSHPHSCVRVRSDNCLVAESTKVEFSAPEKPTSVGKKKGGPADVHRSDHLYDSFLYLHVFENW